MKNLKCRLALLLLLGGLLCLTACSSTKTEHGVTIERQRTANPMSWF